MTFETLVYSSDGPIATITLNRPNELNTIVPPMPDEFEAAINLAVCAAPDVRFAPAMISARASIFGTSTLRPMARGMREKTLPGRQRRRWRRRKSS